MFRNQVLFGYHWRGLLIKPKLSTLLRNGSKVSFFGVAVYVSKTQTKVFCDAGIGHQNAVHSRFDIKESKIKNGSESKKLKETSPWSLLLKLMIKDWKLYLLATVASIITSVCSSTQANLFGKLFDVIGSDFSQLFDPVRKILSLFLISTSFSFLSNLALALASNKLGDHLKKAYFSKILSLDVSFFDENKSTVLLKELTSDINQIQSAVRQSFTRGIESLIGVSLGFYFMYSSSKMITMTLLAILPPMTLLASGLGSTLRAISSEVSRIQGESAFLASEAIQNIKTVKAFNAEQNELDLFESKISEASKAKKKLAISTSGFYSFLFLGINVIALGTLFLGGYLVQDGKISKGDIAAIISQTQMVQRSFAKLSMLVSQLTKTIQNSKNVFIRLDFQPASFVSVEMNQEKLHDTTATTLSQNACAVELKGIKFRYPSRSDIIVFDDFDLKVARGEFVALVGSSGSGKSTVFQLLQNFYLPERGSIKLNGTDISLMPNEHLRKHISIVSQEPILFARSIRENIAYSNPTATLGQIEQAAKKAFAHDFINEFPEGYETMLGERGALLSGGQKQRIAIARAILADPEVLLLDEATSALDTESEKTVQQALKELMKGKTTIIIAHRLSTIENCDKIYVIENGNIIEEGTHEQLLKLNKRYKKLFEAQD